MPFHLELGSEGHPFAHHRAIVVNSRTGEHLTRFPINKTDAEIVKSVAEKNPKFLKAEKKIAEEADKRVKALAGLRKVESETKGRNTKREVEGKKKEAENKEANRPLLEIVKDVGDWVESQDPKTYQEWSRYKDSMRSYRINYSAFPEKIKMVIKRMSGGRIEFETIGETGGKYNVAFTPTEFVVGLQTQDNWGRDYVYRDAFESIGRTLQDTDYLKKHNKLTFIKSSEPVAKTEAKKVQDAASKGGSAVSDATAKQAVKAFAKIDKDFEALDKARAARKAGETVYKAGTKYEAKTEAELNKIVDGFENSGVINKEHADKIKSHIKTLKFSEYDYIIHKAPKSIVINKKEK